MYLCSYALLHKKAGDHCPLVEEYLSICFLYCPVYGVGIFICDIIHHYCNLRLSDCGCSGKPVAREPRAASITPVQTAMKVIFYFICVLFFKFFWGEEGFAQALPLLHDG